MYLLLFRDMILIAPARAVEAFVMLNVSQNTLQYRQFGGRRV